jgi:copper(I)-binding protein
MWRSTLNPILNRVVAGVLFCLGLATLCLPGFPGGDSSAGASIGAESERTIEVTNALSHPDAGVGVGVVYLRIVNHSDRSDRLIAAHTSAANGVAFHETLLDGDIVRMKHRPLGFEIAAGGEIVLESGGKHIMLTQLTGPLESGNSFELELIFEHTEKVLVKIPILPRTR